MDKKGKPALPKKWSAEFEKPILEHWKKNEKYRFDEHKKKPLFSIDMPPPYVNTPIHIGQAATYVLMDMFARFHRMAGFNVLFPLGLDRNGLPIEMAVEKKFGIKFNDISRNEFLDKCRQVLEETSARSEEYFLRLGISFNSFQTGNKIGDMYMTDSSSFRALTQQTFIDLWNKDLIYEAEYLTNYCPGCRTTLADAEIQRKDEQTLLNFVKFKIKETGDFVTISTTRPELLCTAAVIIYNPDDKRYKKLKGKTAITPIFGNEIRIIEHSQADPEFGTGLVFMSASAGDQDAVRFLREMNISPISCIGPDGKMTGIAGFLAGLDTKHARKKMEDELVKRNLMVKQEKILHSVPICERSKHEIEFISMPEFYLKQVYLKEELREMANKTNFFSSHSRQILLDWIDSINTDWPISRRRYYGTEIPIWYCECGEKILPDKTGYVQPWKEMPPVMRCPSCNGKKFHGETRVFDTWFDSSNSPLYILGYPGDFFKKHSLVTLRPQGKEIVRTWLYYTLLKCYQLTGRPIFRDIWINFHIVDERGKKMSKSAGNILSPQDVLRQYGAEPFRLWCAVEGNLEKTDFRCSFERIEGAGKTLAKLWNVARFVSQFQTEERPEKLTETDAWIISEIDSIIEQTRKGYEKYDFHNPAINMRHFIWETFASHYLELAKSRAYDNDKSARYTLNYCLDTILKMLAPVIPFMTYKIYKDLRNKDIHDEAFPEKLKGNDVKFTADDIVKINSLIWKSKKEKGLSLKAGIKEVIVPEKLKGIQGDLIACHNITKISFGKKAKVVL